MPNRIGSTIPRPLLATLAVTVLAGGPAEGVDNCLVAPNAAPSPGSHWYYYVDRTQAQQRHCWYLGPEHRPVHHAVSDAEPTKSAALGYAEVETPLPPLRPASAPHVAAHVAAQTPAEGFVEPASEEAPVVVRPVVVRSAEPRAVADPGRREADDADLHQADLRQADLRQEVIADDQVASPAAVGARGSARTIILILIASAMAAAGFLHHAIFGGKARRPSARVTGQRAGRIASLASGKAPHAFAARHPDGRKREGAAPIDPASFEEEIQQLVRALETRAA